METFIADNIISVVFVLGVSGGFIVSFLVLLAIGKRSNDPESDKNEVIMHMDNKALKKIELKGSKQFMAETLISFSNKNPFQTLNNSTFLP